MGTMGNWKERVENGVPTSFDLFVSKLYSQILIIKYVLRKDN